MVKENCNSTKLGIERVKIKSTSIIPIYEYMSQNTFKRYCIIGNKKCLRTVRRHFVLSIFFFYIIRVVSINALIFTISKHRVQSYVEKWGKSLCCHFYCFSFLSSWNLTWLSKYPFTKSVSNCQQKSNMPSTDIAKARTLLKLCYKKKYLKYTDVIVWHFEHIWYWNTLTLLVFICSFRQRGIFCYIISFLFWAFVPWISLFLCHLSHLRPRAISWQIWAKRRKQQTGNGFAGFFQRFYRFLASGFITS